jgi:hypothetical protein
MAEIGIIGLEEIKLLKINCMEDNFGNNFQREQKINEIAEKVNILIRMKTDEMNRAQTRR